MPYTFWAATLVSRAWLPGARWARVLVIEHDMDFIRDLQSPVTVLHEGHLIRRGVLFFVLYLTWTCYDYIFDLLQAGKPLDVNLAAVIAAILQAFERFDQDRSDLVIS